MKINNQELATPLKRWDIKSVFRGKHYINHACLLEFLQNATGSEIDKKTLNRYLVDWKREGLLYEAGRGWYSDLPEAFGLNIEPVRKLHDVMAVKFPLIDFGCWSTEQIARYHHHLPGKFTSFVYVERHAIKDVAGILAEEFPDAQVLANPLSAAIADYSPKPDNIIVRPLIVDDNGKNQPDHQLSIEKILVDLAIEADYLPLMDNEEFSIVTENILLSGRLNPAIITTRIAHRKAAGNKIAIIQNQLI